MLQRQSLLLQRIAWNSVRMSWWALSLPGLSHLLFFCFLPLSSCFSASSRMHFIRMNEFLKSIMSFCCRRNRTPSNPLEYSKATMSPHVPSRPYLSIRKANTALPLPKMRHCKSSIVERASEFLFRYSSVEWSDSSSHRHSKQIYSKKYGCHLARFTHSSNNVVFASTKEDREC